MALNQTHFRFRNDDSQTLNANTAASWEDALDADVVLEPEQIFRLRFEVEATALVSGATFKLQYRRNNGSWLGVPVVTSMTAPTLTERVEIVPSLMYVNGDATTNILSGSSLGFVAGSGREDNTTGAFSTSSGHTEFEWALRIHKLWGTFVATTDVPGGQTNFGENSNGDTFDFRLVLSDGTLLASYVNQPTVTLSIPAGLVGGCYIEAPRRVGPFKDGSALYLIVECAETNPRITVLKSTDDGTTWVGKDMQNSPTRRDVESLDVAFANNELFMTHVQDSAVNFHSFRTSGNAVPDTWNIKNEPAVSAAEVTTNQDQTTALVRRSDGTFVTVFESNQSGTLGRLSYKVRSAAGVWSTMTEVDSTAAGNFQDSHAVVGAANKVYIFYSDYATGTIYYKTLSTGNVLSARTQVTTGAPTTATRTRPIVAEPTYYDDAGTEKIVIAYIKADLKLYSRIIANGTVGAEISATTETVAMDTTGTTSRMAVAALAVESKKARLIYSDSATRDIWSRESTNGAAWSAATERQDGQTTDFISSLAVGTDIGYMWDAGNAGLTGLIFYAKLAGTVIDPDPGGGGNTPPYWYDNWPPYSWRLFAENAVWNTPLNKNNVDPNSATFIRSLIADGWPDIQTVQRMDRWAFPLYWGRSSDPTMIIRIDDDIDATLLPAGDGVPSTGSTYSQDIQGDVVHAPANMIPSTGTDQALRLLDQVSGYQYHFRGIRQNPGGIDYATGEIWATSGYKLPLYGNGFSVGINNTEPPTGLLPIRPEDIAAGKVNHTVGAHAPNFNAGNPVAPYSTSGGVGQFVSSQYPASQHLSFGHVIFLALTESQIDALNQPQWAKALLKGLCTYGALMSFNGSNTLTWEHKFDRTAYGKPDPWAAVGVTFPLDLGPILDEVGGWEANLRVLTPFARPTGGVNQPPSVNAGADQTITLPAGATLDATVSDDGLPTPPAAVTTTWSKVSGPGTVTFGNANAVDTTATFSVSGTYVLRLTATDSALTTTDDITVTVNAAGGGTPSTQRIYIVN